MGRSPLASAAWAAACLAQTYSSCAFPLLTQVARQQGEYLAEALRLADGQLGSLDELAPPFRYSHKGSMAYVGGGECLFALSFSRAARKLGVGREACAFWLAAAGGCALAVCLPVPVFIAIFGACCCRLLRRLLCHSCRIARRRRSRPRTAAPTPWLTCPCRCLSLTFHLQTGR